MKIILTLICFAMVNLSAFTQDNTKLKSTTTVHKRSYAYVRVEGKLFSKKLKVAVDFGDTEEQQKASKEYTEILNNKKSYAAVLNYMTDQGFELIQTLDLTAHYQGTGGTEGIVFIMKK